MAEINVGQISEALNNKEDLDLNNTNPFADYVVEWQAPTSANNYTWYRLYKSGWVEQGGQNPAGSVEAITITLPIKMSDTNYSGYVTYLTSINSAEWTSYTCTISNRTTTTISYNSKSGVARCWEVKGIASQS